MKKYLPTLLLLFTLNAYADIQMMDGHDSEGTYADAYSECKLLVKSGNTEAQFKLGICYDYGLGVPWNREEAAKWYRLAADKGEAKAQNNLGNIYYYGAGDLIIDYKEAMKWYRLAADQGDAKALNNLGVMYYNGRGVQRDYREAVRWYRLAAEQGNLATQLNLGQMYVSGHGVQMDYGEAVKWFRLAANQGNTKALNNLGWMYANGVGVPKSIATAYALLCIPNIENINDVAMKKIAELMDQLNSSQINSAQSFSREFVKPGNFSKAFDQFTKNLALIERPSTPLAQASQSDDGFPDRPPKRPGVTSCNTSCFNDQCLRTYDDGRKVKFRAKQVWDPFNNTFKFDSGNC